METQKRKPFPTKILVTWEEDRNDEDGGFFVISTEENIEHGAPIGIYELRDTKTMKVTRELK